MKGVSYIHSLKMKRTLGANVNKGTILFNHLKNECL
jgi:hypothetical protein